MTIPIVFDPTWPLKRYLPFKEFLDCPQPLHVNRPDDFDFALKPPLPETNSTSEAMMIFFGSGFVVMSLR